MCEVILYIGNLYRGSTALHRLEALRDIVGPERVRWLDSTPPFLVHSFRSAFGRLACKVAVKLRAAFDEKLTCARIESQLVGGGVSLLWLDKVVCLSADSLRRLKRAAPHCTVVFYTPDDMRNPGNGTQEFLTALPHYDVLITTKSYQVAELKSLGARRVMFVGNAFHPATHRPVRLSEREQEQFGAQVSFCGAYEEDRAQQLEYLVRQGIPVKIFGSGFASRFDRFPHATVVRRWMAEDDYAKVICGAKISLGFLRKANRDLQTTRSIEIPACGGFMLAEETSEHLELFQKGSEADFFSSKEELLQKVRFYLAHEDLRAEIAMRGFRRTRESGYSNQSRLTAVLHEMSKSGAISAEFIR